MCVHTPVISLTVRTFYCIGYTIAHNVGIILFSDIFLIVKVNRDLIFTVMCFQEIYQ